jgi:hypothetical protein
LRDRGLYLTGGFLLAVLFLQWDRVVAVVGQGSAPSGNGQDTWHATLLAGSRAEPPSSMA